MGVESREEGVPAVRLKKGTALVGRSAEGLRPKALA